MTPLHYELDPARLLVPQPLELFRLASAKYANLSGAGAARYPGRWNVENEEALYTSTERGVSLLEKLAHVKDKKIIPANLATLTIHLSGNWTPYRKRSNVFWDESTGGRLMVYRTLLDAREAFESHWAGAGTHPFAVALPSVVVPVWNVVFYPEVNGFWQHVLLKSVETEDPLDRRLFPDEAVFEKAVK